MAIDEVTSQIETFITRWKSSGASERSNAQLFLNELCDLLELPHPDPAGTDNAYVFERDVTFQKVDGSTALGRIDLYKRDSFVLEAKQGSEADGEKVGHGRRGTPAWDQAMIKARNQADRYIRALPADEGRPPFLIVVDVGHMIEIYEEFSCSGGTYVPFPAPGSHRIYLADLQLDEVRDRLKAIWSDAMSLDPSRRSARVTREVADKLANLAVSLEKQDFEAEQVAHFLMRALFTMFAEDVGLVGGFGHQPFTQLLEDLVEQPDSFVPMVEELWGKMNTGGFSTAIRQNLLQFNGGLFSESTALPLDKKQIGLLLEAARCDWRDVEPAIFGTLLERALDPVERHKLGAHYTPRAYVERLVLPTVIQPLREQWSAVLAASVIRDAEGNTKAAIKELLDFHHQLCNLRILDPACGSGNFLYVTLEHLKRIEGEVLDTLNGLGHRQGSLDMHGESVDPHQLLGLEVNPRAAAIAELVLWIGTLQWHFRNRGRVMPPQPIIRDFKNIECRDALLTWDDIIPATDKDGQEITQWDGRSMKVHPVTGKDVPDETARKPVFKYINPEKAEWPEADYIVGNPPFIGKLKMRELLGDGYTETLRNLQYEKNADGWDYVMFWWSHAAELLQKDQIKSFGFITTNSISSSINRKCLERYLYSPEEKIHLSFAIPDHPWVDGYDGAAVRIAMTTSVPGSANGLLQTVIKEDEIKDGYTEVKLTNQFGVIQSNLKTGVDISNILLLKSNHGLCNTGVIPHGKGMTISEKIKGKLESNAPIFPYLNGNDILRKSRELYVIDCYGLKAPEIQQSYPKLYQWLLDEVKPYRDSNKDKDLKEKWWLHRRNNEGMRNSLKGLSRYIVTVYTAKHRIFSLLDKRVLPDQVLVVFGHSDALILGILSSTIHVKWSLFAGGTLEDRPRYNKTDCFETFPFPETTEEQKEKIRNLAEQLDSHRKRQQAQHPDLTMTGMYNVLEKLRSGESLSPKEKIIHEQGLVSVLKQIHDELDTAVADTYGWPADLEEQAILQRLVDLNHQRAAEEADGKIRYLRPDYQNQEGQKETQEELISHKATKSTKKASSPSPTTKAQWPATLSEQLRAIRTLLQASPTPLTETQIAKSFTRAPKKKIAELMDVLEELG